LTTGQTQLDIILALTESNPPAPADWQYQFLLFTS